MKRLALLLFAAFVFSGCNGLNRLLGNAKTESHGMSGTGDITLLIAGQSNGVSMAIVPTDNSYSVTGLVALVNPDDGTESIPAAASPADTSLAWIKLGDMIASSTGRKVKIVNVSIGSTDSTQWATLYASRISGAISKFHPDAVLWVQGENDTFNNFSTDTTYQNYKAILSHSSGTPFYCALDGFMPGLDPAPTRQAQQRIIAEGLAHQGPDIDALRQNTVNMEWTGIHFSGIGFQAHAQAWFDILKGAL